MHSETAEKHQTSYERSPLFPEFCKGDVVSASILSLSAGKSYGFFHHGEGGVFFHQSALYVPEDKSPEEAWENLRKGQNIFTHTGCIDTTGRKGLKANIIFTDEGACTRWAEEIQAKLRQIGDYYQSDELKAANLPDGIVPAKVVRRITDKWGNCLGKSIVEVGELELIVDVEAFDVPMGHATKHGSERTISERDVGSSIYIPTDAIRVQDGQLTVTRMYKDLRLYHLANPSPEKITEREQLAQKQRGIREAHQKREEEEMQRAKEALARREVEGKEAFLKRIRDAGGALTDPDITFHIVGERVYSDSKQQSHKEPPYVVFHDQKGHPLARFTPEEVQQRTVLELTPDHRIIGTEVALPGDLKFSARFVHYKRFDLSLENMELEIVDGKIRVKKAFFYPYGRDEFDYVVSASKPPAEKWEIQEIKRLPEVEDILKEAQTRLARLLEQSLSSEEFKALTTSTEDYSATFEPGGPEEVLYDQPVFQKPEIVEKEKAATIVTDELLKGIIDSVKRQRNAGDMDNVAAVERLELWQLLVKDSAEDPELHMGGNGKSFPFSYIPLLGKRGGYLISGADGFVYLQKAEHQEYSEY